MKQASRYGLRTGAIALFLVVFGATSFAGPGKVNVNQTAVGLTPVVREPGFVLSTYASNLSAPISMAFAPDGRLFVSQEAGEILILEDTDGDDVADLVTTFASGFIAPLGIVFRGDDLYVSSMGKITIVRDTDGDDVADQYEEIITGLPADPDNPEINHEEIHQNNDLVFGPDGKLYVGVGSTCNLCQEEDPRAATVMRFNPDGTGEEIFASGLRNVFDLAFHPEDGTLWATDNAANGMGPWIPPDELDLVLPGGHYGWPDCWGTGHGSNCEGTVLPVLDLEPHSSADGVVFYTGDQFPAEYQNNLFIAMWGSEYDYPFGRKVIRVVLSKENGRYSAVSSPFIANLDRPLDLAVAPDGALMITDYGAGVVYRVVYEITTVSFFSIGSEDGWVLESNEDTDRGNVFDAGTEMLRLGDDAGDRQYRAIVSFDTSPVPDNALILAATLSLRLEGQQGTSPFETHGPLRVDIRYGAFGGDVALDSDDFQAAASRENVAVMSVPQAVGDWSNGRLIIGLPHINKGGSTQFRLHFEQDDNDDLDPDIVRFYSGDAVLNSPPMLTLTYLGR